MEDKKETITNDEYYKLIELYSQLAVNQMDAHQIGYMGQIQAFIFCTKYKVKLEDYINTLRETTEKMLNQFYESQDKLDKIINKIIDNKENE